MCWSMDAASLLIRRSLDLRRKELTVRYVFNWIEIVIGYRPAVAVRLEIGW